MEGAQGVLQAAASVSTQTPRPPLQCSEVLAAAAADHAAEQGPRNETGHDGADGSGPGARVKRRGGGTYVGELISYGWAKPATVVRQLVIYDGVLSRGHRQAIFR